MSQTSPPVAGAASGGASQPGPSLLPESTDLFTAANFALIAILAVLVILGLLYGARLRRRRHEAERELAEHNEEVAERIAPEPAPVAPVVVASAVAPAPPTRAPSLIAPPATKTAARVLEPEPASPPAPAADQSAADGSVTQLKGLGPKVAQRLAEHGITTVGQLAALTDDEAESLDAHMGPFTGRMGRDRWLEQARFLAAGDRAGFEAVFGRL